MNERRFQHEFEDTSRRGFLGGVGAVIAAAAYSGEVTASDAERVANADDGPIHVVDSPDGSIVVTVDVSDGVPTYEVTREGTTYVEPSSLGFDFRNQPSFGASSEGDAGVDLVVTGADRESETETWTPVWGEFDEVAAEYNALSVGLAETSDDGSTTDGRSATLQVRVFDDGLGLRVVLGDGFASNAERAVITAENTGVEFADDYDAWWIPNEVTNPRFEQEYTASPLSEIPDGTRSTRPTDTPLRNGAHTPLTVDAGDAYLSVHEANLNDYAAATLAPRDGGDTGFQTELTPLPDGTKASLELPAVTPWRTIQVVDRPGELIESQLVPLLSDPLDESALPTVDGSPDTDWIEPRKYIGIWWTMIAGSANWEYRSDAEIEGDGDDPAAYVHGARTERMKRYMQFASENGIDSVLVEGWNQGWDTYPGDGSGLRFGVDDSYPDFDVREATAFGASLPDSVEMTMHNETAGNLPNYESAVLDQDVFAGYESEGIRSIKNGYVSDPGLGIDGDGSTATHNQHNQLAVNHHRLVIREAAANRQLLEIHEGIKPTGEIRTYPNVANREVVTAQEFDGFGQLGSNVGREHHVTIPFTRNLAGPVSYQPGIFDITFGDDRGGQVQTTRAKQLAMYPTYLSGLQMAADRVEAYIDETLRVGEALHAAAGARDGFVTDDTWRNAFGTNFVAVDPNSAPSGSSVSFAVRDVESAGTYEVHLRYASDAEDNAPRVIEAGAPRATLRVNDDRTTIEPAFTEYWDDWDVFTTEVELDAGDNDVAIELEYDDADGFTGDVGGFNLNAVAVTESGEPSPLPAEYEGYTPENENFDAEPEFGFIESIPAAGWDETRVVGSAIGEYLAIARRSGDEWYVGVMTNGDGRAVDVPLSFLAPGRSGDTGSDRGNGSGNGRGNGNGSGRGNGNGRSGPKYVAEIHGDAIGAGVDADPTGVRIDEAIVAPSTTLLASLAPSGGTAVRLRPARGREINRLPEYERPEQDITVEIADESDLGEAFITATGSNDAGFIGGTTVEIVRDGTVVAVDNVRLPPNATDETVELGYRISTIGTFDITVREPDGGAELATGTVTVAPGDTIAEFTDPAGDDAGPGAYEYPTDSAFRDGAFDLRSFRVFETDEEYRFAFEVENLYDVFGGDFSPHYFVVYLRDPDADGGRTTALDDLNVTAEFAEPWQYRVDASGFDSGIVTDSEEFLGTPDAFADFTANVAVVSVPKAAFGEVDLGAWEFCPIVGSEDFGAFRGVEVEAGEFVFGGAREDAVENAPRIIDMVTPDGVDQSDALAYDSESLAVLPFVSR